LNFNLKNLFFTTRVIVINFSTNFSDDDLDDYEKNDSAIPLPWKSGSSKSSAKLASNGGGSGSGSESKLSAYDKQLLEEMRGATPSSNPRLTTIDEERSKLKNRGTFLKSNKLAPFDDKSDLPARSNERDRSWALAGEF